MEPNEAPQRLNDDESDFVVRRALELQEAAGKLRSPRDVLAALQELGVEPDFAQQALSELRSRSLEPLDQTPLSPPLAPRGGRRWRALRKFASFSAVALVLGVSAATVAAWQARDNEQARVENYVQGVTDQIRDRQEFYKSRTGEYASRLEDLGKIEESNQDANIELIGGGKSYLAHVEHKWRKMWCEVKAEEGQAPTSSCRF
jgi:hypothetical protein